MGERGLRRGNTGREEKHLGTTHVNTSVAESMEEGGTRNEAGDIGKG